MSDDGADVLYVSSDLFLGSRVRGTIEASGWTLETAGSGGMALEKLESAGPYRIVLVDLETPGLEITRLNDAIEEGGPALVAYGPHVQEQRLAAARQAGCDEVLTRGQFDGSLPQLLSRHLDT